MGLGLTSLRANSNLSVISVNAVRIAPEKGLEDLLVGRLAIAGEKQGLRITQTTPGHQNDHTISLWYGRSRNRTLELYALITYNAEFTDAYYYKDISAEYPDLKINPTEIRESDAEVVDFFCEKVIIRIKANPRYVPQTENLDAFFSSTTPGKLYDRSIPEKPKDSARKSDEIFSYLENLKVVTATKSETTLREAPSAVYIITARMIRERGYRTVAQALEDVPGFQFQHVYGTFPVVVHQRGLVGNNQRSLLYIDGLPDNNISEGAMLNGSLAYPTGNIKQIEIIAGPASSLYGANAFNGIINIITKEVQENKKDGYADITLGTWNNSLTYTAHGVSFAVSRVLNIENNNISMSVAGNYLNSDGPDFRGVQGLNSQGKGYWWSDNYNISDENSYNFNARLNWNNFRAQAIVWQFLSGGGTFANGLGAIDTSSNGFGGNSWDFKHTTTMTGYLYEVSRKLSFDSEGRVRHTEVLSSSHDYDNKISSPSVYNNAEQSLANGNIALNSGYARPDSGYEFSEKIKYAFSESHISTLGIEIAHYSVPIGYGSEKRYDFENYAFYLQHIFKPNYSWSFTAGYRFDENTNYGGAHTPRLSAVYHVSSDLTTKFLFSTGFRAPTPWELFNSTSARIKNPDLKPETLTTGEFGLGYRFLKKYYINMQTYYNRIRNLILEAQTNLVRSPGPPTLYWNQNRNVGNAEVLGAELQTDINLFSNLNVFAGYTFTYSRYIDLTEELKQKIAVKESDAIPNLAPHTVFSGFTYYPLHDLSLHFRMNYTDSRNTIANNPERNVPAYIILHTTANWENFPVPNMFTRLSCRNLTNTQAYDPGIRSADGSYYPSRHPLEGRNIWLTMGITF